MLGRAGIHIDVALVRSGGAVVGASVFVKQAVTACRRWACDLRRRHGDGQVALGGKRPHRLI